jgi:hypothetical protein
MGVVSVQASCALLRTDRPTRPNFQRLHDGQILHMRHAQIERRAHVSQEFILIFVNKLDGDLESEALSAASRTRWRDALRSSRALSAGYGGRVGSQRLCADERSRHGRKIAWFWPPDAEAKVAR